MRSERELIDAILLAVAEEWPTEVRLFRNSVGLARVGTRARMMRFGLAPGSADLIGIGPGGCFLSVEVKLGKVAKLTKQQATWQRMVGNLGGVALVVRTPQDAIRQLREAFQQEEAP